MSDNRWGLFVRSDSFRVFIVVEVDIIDDNAEPSGSRCHLVGVSSRDLYVWEGVQIDIAIVVVEYRQSVGCRRC